MDKINIIGAGLAGCEAAWQAANRGFKVNLFEMRNEEVKTFAHTSAKFAELVCSNSFRNDDISSAIGLLHEEMRRLNSLILQAADANKLPAGSALAMDRENFANFVTDKIINHQNITVINQEITLIPSDGLWIIATGPLTSDKLMSSIMEITGKDKLAFFDAIAPIIYKDSIDFDKAWFQSRYDKPGPGGSGKDYINCPLEKEEYNNFIDLLLSGEKTEFKEWEKNTPYFNGCLPIEVMAERGRNTLRFGPMKPVGLFDPNTQRRPFAVVQLRQDNNLGSLYNMVGFQTKLKYGAQKEIFSSIPALKNAEFARLGGIHRNSFINSPELLDEKLRLKDRNNIMFAGQITGVEGYVESAAIGLLVGIFASIAARGETDVSLPPEETAIGSLLTHITKRAEKTNFQPMNINFGLMPELNYEGNISKQDKGMLYSDRALNKLDKWINIIKYD